MAKAFPPSGDDRDIVAMIDASNAGRIPHLVPLRHQRMMESPFAFFRGTAFIQARDLVNTPDSGIRVQLCGDCHLSNFGGFATPERNLIFDVNDFDETYNGPWEWDLRRLAASFVVAGRYRGFADSATARAVRNCLKQYRKSMRRAGGLPMLEVWHQQIDWAQIAKKARHDKLAAKLVRGYRAKARKSTSERVFWKIAVHDDGRPRIKDQPPLIYHPDPAVSDIHAEANAFLAAYRNSLRADHRRLLDRFAFADAAVKVVGVGSVGTRSLVALLIGPRGEPLFLQIKQAGPSVLDGRTGREQWDNEGERIVTGQRLMQAASDIFLGWSRASDGQDFYVRQLRDMKISADIEDLDDETFAQYGRLCGRALAHAHARSGTAEAIAQALEASPDFTRAWIDEAVRYGDQVERDYAAFIEAVRQGRLAAPAPA